MAVFLSGGGALESADGPWFQVRFHDRRSGDRSTQQLIFDNRVVERSERTGATQRPRADRLQQSAEALRSFDLAIRIRRFFKGDDEFVVESLIRAIFGKVSEILLGAMIEHLFTGFFSEWSGMLPIAKTDPTWWIFKAFTPASNDFFASREVRRYTELCLEKWTRALRGRNLGSDISVDSAPIVRQVLDGKTPVGDFLFCSLDAGVNA